MGDLIRLLAFPYPIPVVLLELLFQELDTCLLTWSYERFHVATILQNHVQYYSGQATYAHLQAIGLPFLQGRDTIQEVQLASSHQPRQNVIL